MEAGLPVELDTLFRIYSMTKPITSVAAMMLYEEGAFELKDPGQPFIPSFADMRVYRAGSASNPVTEPATEPMRIWHLLTHTSGLTYGFHHAHPVDAMYRAAGLRVGQPAGLDLAECCDALGRRCRCCSSRAPSGTTRVSTDVLGRVVEVASGQSLDEFFAERIFEPLGMTDTAFWVADADLDRLAALYVPAPRHAARAVRIDAMGDAATSRRDACRAAAGSCRPRPTTTGSRQMLLGGGELDGVRLLGTRTVDYIFSISGLTVTNYRKRTSLMVCGLGAIARQSRRKLFDSARTPSTSEVVPPDPGCVGVRGRAGAVARHQRRAIAPRVPGPRHVAGAWRRPSS